VNVVPLPRAGPYQPDEVQPKWFRLPEDLEKVFRLGLIRFSDELYPRVVLQVVEDAGRQATLGLTPCQAHALATEMTDAAELAWPSAGVGGEAEHQEEAAS
jgi:hypothetical protein